MIELPRLCEKVRVAGRIGLFRVLRVDYGAQTVDVMSLGHIGRVLKAVPFSDLEALE